MSVILAVAPHPDDETLGCGGTLLRAIAAGAEVHWLIATQMNAALSAAEERLAHRQQEIEQVAEAYGFASVHQAPFLAARLDTVPTGDFVGWIGGIVRSVQPDTLYLPFRDDVHADHAATFDAAAACTKSFRYPSVKRVYAYETLSETEFALRPGRRGFQPNRFVDISVWLERKIEIMRIYKGEIGQHPFPRSVDAIRALGVYRGLVAGVQAAEAFMVLREIE